MFRCAAASVKQLPAVPMHPAAAVLAPTVNAASGLADRRARVDGVANDSGIDRGGGGERRAEATNAQHRSGREDHHSHCSLPIELIDSRSPLISPTMKSGRESLRHPVSNSL